jgi:hypothetical protein
VVSAAGEAPTMANPFAGSATPLIAPGPTAGGIHSVVGGASAYGLLDIPIHADPALAAYIDGAPGGATAMLALHASGVAGFDNTYPGYQMVTLTNFGDDPLFNPTLLGQPLVTYGWVDEPSFGGSGTPTVLTQLDPGWVYAALIPLGTSPAMFAFNDGVAEWNAMLNPGSGVIYNTANVPEPASLALFGSGLAALAWRRRVRQPR